MHIAVAGADGVGLNARSWASTAKAGMKQADAPQEKARPCAFQQIVNINRAKGKCIPWHLYQFVCVRLCVCWELGVHRSGYYISQWATGRVHHDNHQLSIFYFATLTKLICIMPSCPLNSGPPFFICV